MSPARLFQFFLVRLLPMLVLGLVGARAMAQADPPSRVARLNHLEGAAVFSPAGDNEWTEAVVNRPLTRGDKLWTDRGARAEIQVGSSAVRLDGLAHVEILALDDKSAQLSMTQGSLYLRVRSLPEGENFEIDTPNLAYRVAYPGDYRIDVDAAGTTRVTIHSGTGAVYGEGGQVLPLGGGQQVTFRARTLARVATQESPPQDNFDRWALDRNRREDQSISARYVPREVVGYQQLDSHGQWSQDAAYGAVWFPQATAANWAPYRNGHWEWISPWGWTWIDDAPWGFAPFHYGRWAMIGSRWAWVPGRIGLKPVYAPALVAFIGGSSGGVNWNFSLGAGRPGVAWFPLAPGEAWQPGYPASAAYLGSVNHNVTLQADASYANQRKPEALTSISAEDFHRGKPVRANWLRVAANTLTNAQIVPPPPMPERSGVIALRRTAAVRTAAASAPVQQVIADASVAARQAQSAQRVAARRHAQAASQAQVAAATPAPTPTRAQTQAQPTPPTQAAQPQAKARPQQQADAQRVQEAAAQRRAQAEQAQRAEQARRAEQAKADEQAKREKLARRVAQAQREQMARHAEQAKREQVAKRTEQAKREQLAKREQVRREQVAKRSEQLRREEQARRAEQVKREAVARRDEQQRREVHAQHVEQARRAAERDAQALREQRAQREELQAKRDAQEREQAQQREQAQRAAWARQQQALSEQWRRDHQAWEQQQRDRTRQRPDLRDDRRSRLQDQQRGIPIVGSSPTS